MAPNVKEEQLFEENVNDERQLEKLVAPHATPYKKKIDYYAVIYFLYIYIAGIYGMKYIFTVKWPTLIFMYFYLTAGILGLTAGSHRLWSHKSFKAKMPLQIILMLCHSAISQFSVIWWVQIHRQHHKYSDTDGDPLNSTRGIFHSHIGWMLASRHPECTKRQKYVNVSDIRSDPLLVFQKKHAFWFIATMAFFLPSLVPLLWGEDFVQSWGLNLFRLFLSYNMLFTINSVGHTWGHKPYDKNLRATQSDTLQFIAFGDGYHNYHHAFPWDYRSGEFGSGWSFTTMVIDAFAKIGWAYDLNAVEDDIIVARAKRTGDGSKTY